MDATIATPAPDTLTGINALERAMVDSLPHVDCPVKHHFSPGLYTREIFVPAGTFFTTMRHKKEHPFIFVSGKLVMKSSTEGDVTLEAPMVGITPADTQRAIYAITDLIWVTSHITDSTDLDDIAVELLERHDNPLLGEGEGNEWRLQNPPPKLS